MSVNVYGNGGYLFFLSTVFACVCVSRIDEAAQKKSTGAEISETTREKREETK